MQLIFIVTRKPAQFLSVTAVCIALGAAFATARPSAALQAVINPLAEPFAPIVVSVGKTAASPGPPCDRPTPVPVQVSVPIPVIVGPGFGWG